MTRCRFFLITCGLWLSGLVPAMASAEADLRGVSDPTRPPPGVLLKQGSSTATALAAVKAEAPQAAASAASAAASAASDAADARAGMWSLSGIRVDVATGEGYAVVGDEVVSVGDKVNGMTVVSISRQEVLLKGPQGTTRKLQLPDAFEQSGVMPSRSAKRGRKERK